VLHSVLKAQWSEHFCFGVRKSLSERRIRFSHLNVWRNRARMGAKSSHRSTTAPNFIAKM
jgi:hypothetical protein